MTIASIQNLSMDFGDGPLFDDISFSVNEGDFVGLIGANGTGKTTLFKIITGAFEPTEGGAYISKNKKIGYLEQHACQGSYRTVYDEALSVFSDLIENETELSKIASLLDSSEAESVSLIERQAVLQENYQSNGGLTYKSRTRASLIGLGFKESDFNLGVNLLSGGQKSKLSMCKLLLSEPDLILLDEPTNHLDISGTQWLEEFLQGYKGSAIIISHDRYFLDKVTNKTVEISNGKAYSCKGNYSVYQKLRAERIETEKKHYENQLEEIKRIEGIIAQQRQFARERNFITAESKRKMLEKKKAELVEPEKELTDMRIEFNIECETGNDVLKVTDLNKSFGEKTLFSNGSMEVFKGDRAFVLGRNGCGKTTLLKIFVRKEFADSGRFYFGSNVKIGYFDQSLAALRGGKSVLDEIWDEHRTFTETKVRNYLSLFLFTGDDVYRDVDDLSGGEKAKLCLLKLMLSGANVLLLDEPTNHLDIPSREVLEKALTDYEGTIIAVSHDRYFINRLATKIFTMSTNGFSQFDGNYDGYAAITLSEDKKKPEKKPQKVNDYKLRKELEHETSTLKGKIKRQESEIDRYDSEISDIQGQLALPEVATDYKKITELTEKTGLLSEQQILLMEEWEENNKRLIELEGLLNDTI